MNKKAKLYLDIDPYKIIETGFHKERSLVSESLFSLANEYCGVRGFFDETYSDKQLIGSYFNGIYEYAKKDTPNAYLGIVKRTHFTINSTNFFKCIIEADGLVLDLAKVQFKDFYRVLDLKTGLYERSFVWVLKDNEIKVKFSRLLDMNGCYNAVQKITFESLKETQIKVSLCLDGTILHWGSDCYFKAQNACHIEDTSYLSLETISTKQKVVSLMSSNLKPMQTNLKAQEIEDVYYLTLKPNEKCDLIRYVVNLVDKHNEYDFAKLEQDGINKLALLKQRGFESVLEQNREFFANVYDKSDIIIDGSDLDQQGIRYCLFQLASTYHGYDKDNNIGAKGLTGEAYSGHAFWDSETYCLPFYLFTNQEAAKNLLMFRYNTLGFAKERAKDLDCEGACYPIATRNGKEGCNLWQHASLQFQPSTGVFYALWHYMKLYDDKEFMQNYGLEMLIEISKFLLSRGQYNQDGTKFSFYSVMGPDEFQMMVNHNTYTNFMAKKCFMYLLEIINSKEYKTDELLEKCGFDNRHLIKMQDAIQKMVILYDDKTKLFEQHDGFFDLPHIDIKKIPNEDFPLYSHWSYDRIYRNDIIKQPDVLMFMFLFNQEFSLEEKKANYEYYEPKTLHESSLSPSIHSIFACELGKLDEAYKFFNFATRLDLDDYNNNTNEGIHMTSIAAAWMNIVYGFGGLRSDGDILSLSPVSNPGWNYYQFKLQYKDALLNIKVLKDEIQIENSGREVELLIYGKKYNVGSHLKVSR